MQSMLMLAQLKLLLLKQMQMQELHLVFWYSSGSQFFIGVQATVTVTQSGGVINKHNNY